MRKKDFSLSPLQILNKKYFSYLEKNKKEKILSLQILSFDLIWENTRKNADGKRKEKRKKKKINFSSGILD